ncbi:MAG: hypothetical protein U0441_30255 [Polyangiaceae bacterium]
MKRWGQRMFRQVGLVGLVGVLSTVSQLGCDYSCYSDLTCSLGTAGTAGSNGAERCPDPANGSIEADCGIWVSASLGDDANTGTPDAPLKTLGAAILLAQKGPQRIYACSETYEERLSLPAGVSLFGGFECAGGWSYVGGDNRARIAPSEPGVALNLAEGQGVSLLRDIAVTAKDAMGAGESSIAILALPGSNADLRRSRITAGNGARGADGADGKHDGEHAKGGLNGNNGVGACAAAFGLGGDSVFLSCDDGSSSMGGNGGNGGEMFANDGADGVVAPTPNPQGFGLGGAGEASLPCTGGLSGAEGQDGAHGEASSSKGRLTQQGYLGADGADGQHGFPGQGGGGGGASRGKATCGGALHGGPGGGSGGTGGCGGRGGKGGQAGGSSIGIALLGTSLYIEDSYIVTGNGGDGGNGGVLQPGGQGGLPGIGGAGFGGPDPINAACVGGGGGYGGNGGHGAGGHGGHSVFFAVLSSVPFPNLVGLQGGRGTVGVGGHGGDPSWLQGYGKDGESEVMVTLDP